MDFRSESIDLRGAELHLNAYGPDTTSEHWRWQLVIESDGAMYTVSGIPLAALEDLRIAAMAAQSAVSVSTQAAA